MRTGDFLDALRHMPMATPADVIRSRPIVVLSPHPDDESLGVGGLIAATAAAGHRVEIVFLTNGGASHPGSRQFPHDRLVALRRAEAAEAAAWLGLAAGCLTHLDLPDAHAPTSGPAFEAAVDRLVGVVDEARAGALFVTWGGDPHCDHEVADRMARAVRDRRPALALWSYPIWGWHRDPDSDVDAPAPDGFRIDIAPWLGAKRSAIAAHASQMTDLISDDPDGFRFTPATLAPFLAPVEYVFAVPR